MASISMSGLTGIDFGSLADALVQIRRNPITLLEDRQTQAKNKVSMYEEVVSSIKSLRDAAKALTDQSTLKFTSFYSSDEDVLTVSGGANPAVGSYQVYVQQLATATRVTSGFKTQLGIGATADLDEVINDRASNVGYEMTSGYFTINGTQVNMDPDVDSVQDVIDRINSTVTGVTASYDAATDRLKLSSATDISVGSSDDTSDFLKKTGLTASESVDESGQKVRTASHRLGRLNTGIELADSSLATPVSGTGSFKINGIEISYDADEDSLNDIITRINTNVASVTASYDSQTDKIVLASRTTGSLGISMSDETGNLLRSLGLLTDSGDSSSVVALGQNAKVTIPGFNGGNPIYSTSNTIEDAIPGVEMKLQQTSADPISIKIERDSSDLKSKLQSFVTAFNAATSLISSRLTEEPLEDATSATLQRVGLLRGDSLLSTVRSTLVSTVTGTVTGLPTGFQRLGNLGISISSTDYKTSQLAFDTEDFDDLFEDNPEKLYDILFQDADSDGTIDDGELGVIPNLLGKLDDLISETSTSVGGTSSPEGLLMLRIATLNREAESYDDRIETLEDRLEEYETRIRKQFSAAETKIAQLQALQSQISYYG